MGEKNIDPLTRFPSRVIQKLDAVSIYAQVYFKTKEELNMTGIGNEPDAKGYLLVKMKDYLAIVTPQISVNDYFEWFDGNKYYFTALTPNSPDFKYKKPTLLFMYFNDRKPVK